jgi:hypothetical protein
MRVCVVIAAAAACGRLDFDAIGSAGDGGGGDAASGFCANEPVHALCDDFDEGRAAGSGWTRVDLLRNGSVTIASTPVVSAPGSLEAAFPQQTGSASDATVATIEYDAPAATSSLTWSYDVYLAVRPANSQVEIQGLILQVAGVQTAYMDLMLKGSGSDSYREETTLQGGTQMANDSFIPRLTTGTWHHCQMTVDFAAQTHQMTIDGTIVSAGATHFPTQPGLVTVQNGINFANQLQPGWVINTDNVTIDVQ